MKSFNVGNLHFNVGVGKVNSALKSSLKYLL
jgi:hypothetical protein